MNDSWKGVELRIFFDNFPHPLRHFLRELGDDIGQREWDRAQRSPLRGPLQHLGEGPNKRAVGKGKHSRWSLHLQREAGSKARPSGVL